MARPPLPQSTRRQYKSCEIPAAEIALFGYSSNQMTTATHAAIETPTSSKPSRGAHFAIYGAALLMRLLAMWTNVTSHPHTWFFSHPWEMGLLASSLLHHQGYSSPFGVPTGPTAFIAPGYPTIIAGIFAIFGIATFASALVIIGMHIMLALLTIWIVMHLAGSLFGRNAAIVAGTFWALSPPLWFIPAIFWETSFSAAFIVAPSHSHFIYATESRLTPGLYLAPPAH